MGKVNKLNEEEKNRRLRLLEHYDRWGEGSQEPSASVYCALTGSDKTDLARCVKWRKSLRQAVVARQTGFVRLVTEKGRGEEPVRVSVGDVSIEVGPASSGAALATVLSALGVSRVL